MKWFFIELQTANSWLSIGGWISLLFAVICAIMTQFSDTMVLGINATSSP
jgi:hypothetical protein